MIEDKLVETRNKLIEDIASGKMTVEDGVKQAIEKGRNFGFRLGVEHQIGEFSKKPVPLRDYSTSRLHIKDSVFRSIGSSMNDFEKMHKVKIPMKSSLKKRIAGNVFNIFERWKNFVEERNKHESI
jgi:hypothetical protein